MAGTSLISTLAFDDLVDTTERMYAKASTKVADLDTIKGLFKVESIPNGTGDRRIYDEYDGETYARLKVEGGDAQKVRVVKGYTKTLTAKRVAAEIDITFEARTFGKDKEIISRLTSLSTFVPQRMALDGVHRFSFYLETSYVDMDGETVDLTMGDTFALGYASHSLTGSALTYSTLITGNPLFSSGALEIAMNQANTQILSNFGEQRVLNFDTVVTGNDPATVKNVKQLLNSTADVDSSNSGVSNEYKGMFRHVILPRLATTATGAHDSTKSKYWFYIASADLEAHLGIWEAPNLKTPSSTNNGVDVHNDDWTFGTRGTYGYCIVCPKGFLGSTGLGA
jgi:hypothetical protein